MIPRLTTIAAIAAASALPAAADTTQADLVGVWQSPLREQPAPAGTASAFLRQTVRFTTGSETMAAEAFVDAEGTVPLFTYASTGPWESVGPAPGIPGALALELRNDRSEMTIFVDAPEIWEAIGMGGCDLVLGQAVDIADCVSGPPFMVADCTDLDVVMVDEGGRRLRFGAEGVDRCETRPTTLSETAFLRVE